MSGGGDVWRWKKMEEEAVMMNPESSQPARLSRDARKVGLILDVMPEILRK